MNTSSTPHLPDARHEGATLVQHLTAASDLRAEEGFLTVAEVAERFDIRPERIAGAVAAGKVCSVTFRADSGETLTVLPIKDELVAAWINDAENKEVQA